MKTRICICGHNYFTHNAREKHSWHGIFRSRATMIITFSSCRQETCICENFIEKQDTNHGRK